MGQTYILALAQYLLELRWRIGGHLLGGDFFEEAVILVPGVWAMLSKAHLLRKVTANTVKGYWNSNSLSAHDQDITVNDTLIHPAESARLFALLTLGACRVVAGHDRM